MNMDTELAVPPNPGIGIVRFQLSEQVEQGTFLCIRACIGRTAFFVESAFVADADALVVPAGGMSANLMYRTANVYFTVAGDIEMIADIGKAPRQMAAAKRLHRKITVATCSAAMNYQEAYLPIVLIETACFHPANG